MFSRISSLHLPIPRPKCPGVEMWAPSCKLFSRSDTSARKYVLLRHSSTGQAKQWSEMFCWSLRPYQVNGLLLMPVRIVCSVCLETRTACFPTPRTQVIEAEWFQSLIT